MRHQFILPISICCLMMIFATSCEKADIQKSLPKDDSQITSRADNCDNCPAEDCCCRVILTSGTSAPLYFCGTTNPEWSTNECSILLENCPDISGYYWLETLDYLFNPDEFFCVAENSSFMIGIGNGSVSLTLTCQYGQSLPQTLNISLSNGQKLYYTVDENCELSECHPEE